MPTTSTDQPFLVFNCEACGQEGVSAMDKHERLRISSASNIDPARRHLNRTLHGNPGGPAAALADLYASGVLQPARQAHRPYLRIVMGASPTFFRPHDPDLIGTWVPERLQTWLTVALAALRMRFGDDLVHVSLHLDEDTPHLHILVAPTYWNKPRKIDRRRKAETDAAFKSRQAAAEADPGRRTVGRASHPTLKLQGSIATLRAAFGSDFAHLGIHPGHPRGPDDPKPKTTRQWINEERVRLEKEWAALAAERAEIPRLKEAAIRQAFAQVHAHYQAEIAGLQKKMSNMLTAVTAWMKPLVALRNEAAAEVGLVARIRQAFKGRPDAEVAAARSALHRLDVVGHDGSEPDPVQRATDEDLLAPYRALMSSLATADSIGEGHVDGLHTAVAIPDGPDGNLDGGLADQHDKDRPCDNYGLPTLLAARTPKYPPTPHMTIGLTLVPDVLSAIRVSGWMSGYLAGSVKLHRRKDFLSTPGVGVGVLSVKSDQAEVLSQIAKCKPVLSGIARWRNVLSGKREQGLFCQALQK